ncbi:MAG: hypothetical protein JWR80_8335, partial [Bradyrhizobium sp.]|nr:hypothetical protein [Bradyrhizobium sp.]
VKNMSHEGLPVFTTTAVFALLEIAYKL